MKPLHDNYFGSATSALLGPERPVGMLAGELIVAILMFCPTAFAATYYVDFAKGSDGNIGTSAEVPWQHAPGDSNATDGPAAAALRPGDTIIFKGGVAYRGLVSAKWNGTAAQPIIYDGNTAGSFGVGRALIEGADPLTNWTKCASANDCLGNPYWTNLFYTTVPTNMIARVLAGRLHQNDELLWVAQEPDLTNPFLFDEVDEYFQVPPSSVTTTSIVDSAVLKGGDSNRWVGTSVIIWHSPNVVSICAITGYDPEINRITFTPIDGSLYTDRNTRYSLFNGIHALDQEGEYAILAEGNNYRIFLWPRGSQNISEHKIQISVRPSGLSSNSKSHLVYRGFALARQFGIGLLGGIALGDYQRGSWHTNVFIHDNVIKHTGNPAGAYAAIYLYQSVGSIVSNNVLVQLSKSRAIFLQVGRLNCVVGNAVTNVGRTGITFYTQTNSLLRANWVVAGGGVHANGMNVYSSSDGVLVDRNYVADCSMAFTYSSSANLDFFNNMLISTNERCFATFGDIGGTNRLYNNNFLESPSRNSVYIRSAYRNRFHFGNNILAGSDFGNVSGQDSVNRETNIFLSVWSKAVVMGPGEIYCTNLTEVFVNPLGRDYRLRANSPAIGAASPFNAIFKTDFGLKDRGQTWDIGVFEYDPLEGTVQTKPSPPTALRVVAPL
jgi:hypothetical protein